MSIKDAHPAIQPRGASPVTRGILGGAMIRSHAQNFEDVILWRALRDVGRGTYLDIGAQDPMTDSVSLAFYEKGWRGVHVEPNPAFAEAIARARPDEEVVRAAVGSGEGTIPFFRISGTGLSTGVKEIAEQHRASGFEVERIEVPLLPLDDLLGRFEGRPLHWLKIDVEGMEKAVLESWTRTDVRPWVVVIEATVPVTGGGSGLPARIDAEWRGILSEKGYREVYFDGLNAFHLAEEHSDLAKWFAVGPNLFDGFDIGHSSWLGVRWIEERAALERRAAAAEREGEAARDRLKAAEREGEAARDRLKAAEGRLEEEKKRTAFLDGEILRRMDRPFVDRLLFRPSGKPKRPLRRILFHTSGKPRGMFRRRVLNHDGSPRRAFRQWMTGPEYNALRWPSQQPVQRAGSRRSRQTFPQEIFSTSDEARYDAWIRLWEMPEHLMPGRPDAPGVSVLIGLQDGETDRLERTLGSLGRQSLTDWQVLIAPVGAADGQRTADIAAGAGLATDRVDVLPASPTLGAALEAASARSDRPFILALRPGDVLPARALATLSTRMAEDERLDVVYGDEDVLDGMVRRLPQLKPDWSPELLTSYDYLGAPVLLRRSAVQGAGSFDPQREAGAPWDFHLRLLQPDFGRPSSPRVARVTEVLCHRWPSGNPGRPDPADAEASLDFRTAVADHWRRLGLEPETEMRADGTVRSRWHFPDPPLVSIIIPSRDRAHLLRVTLDGLLDRTDYPRKEIIVVDNGSTETDTLNLYEQAQRRGVRVVPFQEPFNYSRACNIGAAAATGDLLLFLNNDVEVRDPDWLGALARYACLPGVGVVGTKLNYPDGVLQHSGVVVGMHICGLVFHRADEDEWGPFGSPTVARNWLGIMGACQMVRRDTFDRIGGFDENYRIAMSDVKLSMDAWCAGYRTVCVPSASLFHHEGASRGKANPEEDMRRTLADVRRLGLQSDPYFHPSLSAVSPVPTLRLLMEPNGIESLASYGERMSLPSVGENDPIDLYNDDSVSVLIGQPVTLLRHDKDVPANLVLWLLRRRPDIRARFPKALSEGRAGKFTDWLENEGWNELSLPGRAKDMLDEAYGAELESKALLILQCLISEGTATLPTPGANGKTAKSLFAAVASRALSVEAAWWLLIELDEEPSLGILWSWLLNPEWQDVHPLGATRFGRAGFARWLSQRGEVSDRFLDPVEWLDILAPADQFRLLLRSDDWRTRFPEANLSPDTALRFVKAVAADHPDAGVREWIKGLDIIVLAEELARPGMTVLGHFSYPSGLRTSTCALVEGAEIAGGVVAGRNVPVGTSKDGGFRGSWLSPETHDVTVIHVQPEPFFLRAREQALLASGNAAPYTVGFWYWEFDEIPPGWDEAAAACDELWTATNFIGDALKARYDKPVHVFLPGIRVPEGQSMSRARLGLSEKDFVFLFTFHMNSIMERKNPLGLIAAFQKAFDPTDNAVLVIKTSFGSHNPDGFARMRAAAEGARISIIDDIFTEEEMRGLMLACDAYVSLHRSEGLGLTMAEAMLMGRPTIATGYSGNLDFMDVSNSLLVDHTIVELGRDHPPYKAGQRWAEPSTDSAARHMRRLYEDRDFATNLGGRARADLIQKLSLESVGEQVLKRIAQIRAGL